MARTHFRTVTAPTAPTITARLGLAGTAFNVSEQRKFVKPAGTVDQGYVLCAQGDLIDGHITSVAGDRLTAAGFAQGSVQRQGQVWAMADGSEAAGIGNLAVGDAVVCGAVVPQNTALPLNDHPKVRKATLQPNLSVPGALADVPVHINAASYWWKVASLYTAGTGAPGTMILIERVNY
jgi:hypothetical protein